jgi:flagellar M-ring protein FliF
MDDERRPSASVMLRLRPGAQLSRKQTQGITYLVSGSVEGLTPDRVNLVDEYGTLLAGGRAPDAIDGDGSSRLEVKSSVENWLEAKAQTLLDRVVGPGKSVVRVTAELDFERIEKEIETYDPDNVVVRSEELNEQTQGEGGGQTRNSVTNYEINRTVEKLVKAPGALDRLTIAVTVDGRYQEAAAAGKGKDKDAQPVFVRRTDAELRDLGAVVKNAVGFDGRRGDLFHIACIQFEDGYLVEEQEEMERVDRQMLFQTLLRYGLLAAGIALAAFVLLKIARAMARTFEQVRLAPTEAGGAPGLDVGAGTRAQVGALIEQVNRTTRAKPQESAAVIRTMIAEGD